MLKVTVKPEVFERRSERTNKLFMYSVSYTIIITKYINNNNKTYRNTVHTYSVIILT